MPIYPFVDADGKEFDVEAPDAESADKAFKQFRQETLNKSYEKAGNEAPEWVKPFLAARDVGVKMADTGTFGFGAKGVKALTGFDAPAHAEAISNNMGLAGTALDIATMARFLPTAVPKAMAWMGGGPAARVLTGTGAAATEGGVVGGLQAAGHDQDVGTGALLGAGGGAAGQQVGGILNRANKWIRGIDDSVPQGIRSKLTVLPNNASATDKVTVAANQAGSKARLSDDPLQWQTNTESAMEKLLRTEPRSFTPAQRSMMNKVVDEDPATKASRMFGNMLTDKLAVGGAGLGVGFANPIAGIAMAGGMLGGGRALKGVSAGGTKEAMDDLLREMRGRAKYQGPLSPEKIAEIRKLIQQGAIETQGLSDGP